MGKAISFTIHPPALDAEYLAVSDAMHQVLDLVDALERTEADQASERKIVWRLTEAHTNSPPFTVTAEAFPIDPEEAIDRVAKQAVARFSEGMRELLAGRAGAWMDREIAIPLKRLLQRNTTAVGRTQIAVDGDPIEVLPASARAAVAAIERLEVERRPMVQDLSRTEYGAVEVEVSQITRWNNKPALMVLERLSRGRVTCVLSQELADRLGPQHKWNEAWSGDRLLITGALHYNSSNVLSRIDVTDVESLPWADVPLVDLKAIDLLNGRSVSEHLNLIRGATDE